MAVDESENNNDCLENLSQFLVVPYKYERSHYLSHFNCI